MAESKDEDTQQLVQELANKIPSVTPDSPHYVPWYKLLMALSGLSKLVPKLRGALDDDSFSNIVLAITTALSKGASFRASPELGAFLVDTGVVDLLLSKVSYRQPIYIIVNFALYSWTQEVFH